MKKTLLSLVACLIIASLCAQSPSIKYKGKKPKSKQALSTQASKLKLKSYKKYNIPSLKAQKSYKAQTPKSSKKSTAYLKK